MGKALYREYRPRSLDEVVGQEHITTTLKNAIKKGVISHAYLFTGPRGVGKTSIARILAHEINGLDYSDESIHLDIIEIDAASNRRIDEIRDLRDKVHIAPTSAKYKVYIIDEVHMLTREAFNALLKTLEEPPAHVVFILATTENHKVPDTIASRTQRFNFHPIINTDAVKYLKQIADKEKIKLDEEVLDLIATHGKGSFRDSISILDQLSGIATDKITLDNVKQLLGIPPKEIIINIVKAVKNQDMQAIFTNVQTLKEQGIDSGKAAQSIGEMLRQKLLDGVDAKAKLQTVKIMKNLLPISTSSNDFVGLELALIDSLEISEKIDKSEQIKNEVPQTETVQAKTEPKMPIVETKIELPQKVLTIETAKHNEKVEKPTIEKSSFSKDKWNELLNELKKKYNTLYGVLRMAEIDYENKDSILLKFKFGFHKKQVDIPANTAVIRDYLNTYFGINSFTTVTVKEAKITEKPTASPQKIEKSDVVASVSNIFDGAELLES